LTSRKDLALQLPEWVGPDRLEIVDLAMGWPSHTICRTEIGAVRLAAHLGTIGKSKRNVMRSSGASRTRASITRLPRTGANIPSFLA